MRTMAKLPRPSRDRQPCEAPDCGALTEHSCADCLAPVCAEHADVVDDQELLCHECRDFTGEVP